MKKKSLLSLLSLILMNSSLLAHEAKVKEKTVKESPLSSSKEDKEVEFKEAQLILKKARIKPKKKGHNTAAFVTLKNLSSKDRALIAASTPIAKAVELHLSSEENGIHKMRPVKSIPLPAQGEAVLKSGSYHVMLIDLKKTLKKGMEIPLMLEFDDGTRVEALFEVRACKCCRQKGQ